MIEKFDLIVVGGGAAGFFGAICAAENNPRLKIMILEKSGKLLSKVKVSGGGRCNVTHHCFDPVKLSKHYPRGSKQLRHVFREFSVEDTIEWFASKGVKLKTEDDNRMFPVTDNSQTIIDCFLREARRFSVRIETGQPVMEIKPEGNGFKVITRKQNTFYGDKVLIATGGSPAKESYAWLASHGHTVVQPIPSLFTFNDPQGRFKDLMGVSVNNAEVKIAGTRFSQTGPLLITHWGLSGPAVLKLSAWAAEYLFQQGYNFTALVSWIGQHKEDSMRSLFLERKHSNNRQKVYSNPLFNLPQRLWLRLCELAEIEPDRIWAEMSNRNINKLIEYLIRCPFNISGKTTFKEEFVTCGGISLDEIDFTTMESKKVKGLYFAGEVLNIDGETGGFNFQAAWSTASVAARAMAREM